MRKRTYYRQYGQGMPVSAGQIVKYTVRQGGNSHAYLLKALVPSVLSATPNYAMFEVLNPTTFVMTSSVAASANPVLLEGDRLLILDTNETVENTESIALLYSTLTSQQYHSGKLATVIFEAGENNVQVYEINNRFQAHLPETVETSPQYTIAFDLQVLATPDDFSGFVKVINKTAFEALRATYPIRGVTDDTVTINMSYPAGISVTATYDTGSSYENTAASGDFFYLEFTRAGGGNLVIVKHPINTVPDGI